MEAGLESNIEKLGKCCLPVIEAAQNHFLKIANRSFENVAQIKHLEMRAINQNSIQEDNEFW
jgi:hypothetical protein